MTRLHPNNFSCDFKTPSTSVVGHRHEKIWLRPSRLAALVSTQFIRLDSILAATFHEISKHPRLLSSAIDMKRYGSAVQISRLGLNRASYLNEEGRSLFRTSGSVLTNFIPSSSRIRN
ncbi:hypothetical protein CEXT_613351 [Caerostris extrusa]|uniref:Uncharacterized protein n=1 Tax=Caerostris extrusa TaxID=172846 RepID=A0AAV4P1Q0_CAEEX|nr:hypothetical protein CEXT_613351 [Caerostris extrusa]